MIRPLARDSLILYTETSMKLTVALIWTILTVLLCELCDPSSNFIRVSNSHKAPARSQLISARHNPQNKLKVLVSPDKANDDDGQNSAPSSLDDSAIHCASPAYSFAFIIEEPRPLVYLVREENPPDDFYPSIFQPPKIA